MGATNSKIQLRRDTAANWSTYNPTLSAGEPGFETDTGKLKIGDGHNAWSNLKYAGNGSDNRITVQQTGPDVRKDIAAYMIKNSITGPVLVNDVYYSWLRNAYLDNFYAMIKDYSSESFAVQNNIHKLGEDIEPSSVEFNIVEFYNKEEIDSLLSGYATEGYVDQEIFNSGFATEGYVDQEVTSQLADALSSYVKTSGNQNIGGTKTFTGTTNFNVAANFANGANFNGIIKNSYLRGGRINLHPEGNSTTLTYFVNDLTGLLSLGGTCTCTRTDKDGNLLGEPLSEYNRKQWFNGTTSYGGLVSGGKWQSATPNNEPAFAVTDIVTIDIDFSAWKNFAWTTTAGIGFGSSEWRAKDVKVETNYIENGVLSTWREVYNVTNSDLETHHFLSPGPSGTSGEKCNRIRITLTNFNNTSEARIAGIWMIGYNSKSLASTLVSRVDGTMLSHFLPEKTDTYDLGSSAKRWNIVNANTIRAEGHLVEGGTYLYQKYGRLGVSNTWSSQNTFTHKTGTKDYTDAEGNVVYTEDLYSTGIQAYYSNIAVKPTSITWWMGASKATDTLQVLPELSGSYAALPFGTHWHDQFAFCKKVTPTFETTTDGTTWTAATLNKNLFNQKMSQAIPVITDTICGSRWTWSLTSNDLKNGNGEWLVLGRSWSSAWPDMRILIEVKNNSDANWTILTDVTYPAGKGTITPLFIRPYTGYMTNYDQLRITISKKPGSAGTQSLSAMKMLTNRWGGQGYGTELHFPYDWDADQNINLNGNLKIKNKTIEAIIDERVGTSGGGADMSNYYTKSEVEALINNSVGNALEGEY